MHDVLLLVARPKRVLLTGFQRGAHAMQRRHEIGMLMQLLHRLGTHAGHDLHIDSDVGRVRELDAEGAELRSERAHAEWDDIHRATAHAAGKQLVQVRLSI